MRTGAGSVGKERAHAAELGRVRRRPKWQRRGLVARGDPEEHVARGGVVQVDCNHRVRLEEDFHVLETAPEKLRKRVGRIVVLALDKDIEPAPPKTW